MEAHRENADLRGYFCLTLYNLAANRVSSAKAGGVTTIMNGMETHSDHTDAQQQGRDALVSFACGTKEALLIEEAGGFKVIEAAFNFQYARWT